MIAYKKILKHKKKLADFCQLWSIKQMSLFGSVLSSRFNHNSDIDVLVNFDRNARWSLMEIIDMKNQLQALLGREVDIVEDGTIKNPIKRKAIYSKLEVIYESGK